MTWTMELLAVFMKACCSHYWLLKLLCNNFITVATFFIKTFNLEKPVTSCPFMTVTWKPQLTLKTPPPYMLVIHGQLKSDKRAGCSGLWHLCCHPHHSGMDTVYRCSMHSCICINVQDARCYRKSIARCAVLNNKNHSRKSSRDAAPCCFANRERYLHMHRHNFRFIMVQVNRIRPDTRKTFLLLDFTVTDIKQRKSATVRQGRAVHCRLVYSDL